MTRTESASGYVVPAKKLATLFIGKTKADYLQLLNEKDEEKLEEFLMKELPDYYPVPEQVFEFKTGEEGLTPGVIYALFANCDLFTCTPSDKLIALKNKKIEPTFENWTTFF